MTKKLFMEEYSNLCYRCLENYEKVALGEFVEPVINIPLNERNAIYLCGFYRNENNGCNKTDSTKWDICIKQYGGYKDRDSIYEASIEVYITKEGVTVSDDNSVEDLFTAYKWANSGL